MLTIARLAPALEVGMADLMPEAQAETRCPAVGSLIGFRTKARRDQMNCR